MNQHQEHHHGLHHQEQSENHTQREMIDVSTGEARDRESVLDELERSMFERAR